MGNVSLNPTQSNTRFGGITAVSAADLSGKEGYLATVATSSGVLQVNLPAAVSSLALYLIDDGGSASGEDVCLSPIHAAENFRVKGKGVIVGGARVVLADPGTPADKGKVRAVPATEGVYFSPGIAEEDGEDGQLVLIRPDPQLVYVGTAFTSAAPAATAPTNSSPYGFTQAQAQAILTNLIELRAFAVAQGWKPTA